MKIIAIKTKTVLVEMQPDELANVLGHYSTYHGDYHKTVKKAEDTGEDLKVSSFYNHHRGVNNLLKQLPYLEARKKLEEMVVTLKAIEPLLGQLPIDQSMQI